MLGAPPWGSLDRPFRFAWGHRLMSLPIAAIGALVAALLETSVLPELAIFGIKPDLVFVLTAVAAAILGFEDALVWSVVGGVSLDAMSAHPLGASTLALLVVTGAVTLLGRLTGTHRLITVSFLVFLSALLFQLLVLAILAVTAGVGPAEVQPQRLVAIAVLDLILAAVSVASIRALLRRFGPTEQLAYR